MKKSRPLPLEANLDWSKPDDCIWVCGVDLPSVAFERAAARYGELVGKREPYATAHGVGLRQLVRLRQVH